MYLIQNSINRYFEFKITVIVNPPKYFGSLPKIQLDFKRRFKKLIFFQILNFSK